MTENFATPMRARRNAKGVAQWAVTPQRNGLAELAIKPGEPVPTDRIAKAVYITPALAQDWLDRYSDPQKRHIRPFKVDDYALKMATGDWVEMSKNIEFTFNGVTAMSDGHHRMKALVRSGVDGLWFEVHFGADIRSRRIEGIRQTRSPADMLRMEGCTRLVTEIGAGVRLALLYEQTVGTDTRWRNSSVDIPDSEDITLKWLDDPATWDATAAVAKGLLTSWPNGMAQAAALAFTFHAEKAHPGQGETFLRLTAGGGGPVDGRGKTVLSIMIQLLRVKPAVRATVRSGTQKDWDRYTMAVFIRAFNAWLVGRPDFSRPEWTEDAKAKAFTLDRVR